MNPVIQTILAGDIVRLKSIIKQDMKAIDTKDEEGVWAPFLAATTGNLELVKYIVEYTNASMNEVDEQNRNILHYAAMSDNVELVKYLVERIGMNPRSASCLGKTPLDIAISLGNGEVIRYFEIEQEMNLEKMYRNPIVSGAHPDPSIIRVDEDYYMVNSTFVYFPAIPILHSRDLVNWRIIGHAVTDPTYLNLDEMDDGRGIWAPDISYHNGKFYIVATYRLNDTEPIIRKQMVVSAVKPEGPYSQPVFIEEDGIDPSLFTDEDGKRYMLLNRGARIFEVSEDATQKLSEPKMLWYGENKRAPEGPHLIKKDGYYYLFVAEGGTGPKHCISVARSKELMGVYESCPYNPIMTQRNPLEAIQRAGHGKPVQTQTGEWFMVYLCGRRIGGEYCILGRETSMDPITWTADGWPIINKGQGPSVIQNKPQLPECKWEECTTDHFEGNELGLDWLFVRNADLENYKVNESKLRIYGTKADLNHKEAKNIIVRRQKHFCFEASSKLEIQLNEPQQEAGLTCYYDTLTYIKFGILQKAGQKVIRVVERITEEENVYFEQVIKNIETVYLKVKTQYLARTFSYSYDGEVWMELGTLGNVYYLSDEGVSQGKRFTGTMIGMYVISGENKERAYAEFDYFKYEPMIEEE